MQAQTNAPTSDRERYGFDPTRRWKTRHRGISYRLSRSLERRGISLETYLRLTNENPDALRQRLLDEAQRSVARELVLEAVADQVGVEVSDEEIEELIRMEAAAAEEDAGELVERVRGSATFEQLRQDLRLRKALDRVVPESLFRGVEQHATRPAGGDTVGSRIRGGGGAAA